MDVDLLPQVLVNIVNEYDGRYPLEAWQRKCREYIYVCFGTQPLSKFQQWTFRIHSPLHYLGISTNLSDIQSLKVYKIYEDEISMDQCLYVYRINGTSRYLNTKGKENIRIGDNVHLLLDGNCLYVAVNQGLFYLLQDTLKPSLAYYPFCLTQFRFATPL